MEDFQPEAVLGVVQAEALAVRRGEALGEEEEEDEVDLVWTVSEEWEEEGEEEILTEEGAAKVRKEKSSSTLNHPNGAPSMIRICQRKSSLNAPRQSAASAMCPLVPPS